MTLFPTLDRPSARLLVLDSQNRLLLFRFEHKNGPLVGTIFWATPGGALDPGETFEQAACRELFEEAGFKIDDPGPQIARREAQFRLTTGEMARADERYFLVRAGDIPISRGNWTELEREVMTHHRWWTRKEISASKDQIWPENLVDILIDASVW